MTYHLYEETSHAKRRLDLIQFLPCKLWVKIFFFMCLPTIGTIPETGIG